MRQDVPLAAPDVSQIQDQPPERELASPGPAGLSEPAWEAFYALLFVACTVLVEAQALDPARRIAASVALAAMIPWYLLLARPVMRLDTDTWLKAVASWRGPLYLTGITALLAVALYANPNAWFLAFALCPQCFQLNPSPRRAMGFVILLNGVAGLMFVLNSRTAENIGTAVGVVLFSVAFSEVFSRWTARVIEQSHERDELIAELRSAQAELAAVSHEAGVLAERQRLAADIHDTLAQGFLSIVTLVQAAQAQLPQSPVPQSPLSQSLLSQLPVPQSREPGSVDAAGAVAEHLDLALATARENLAEARALVAALTPATLDDGGLAGALARAAAASGRAAGVTASCVAEGPARPLPTGTEVVLLRVCQESLANVGKHAAATRVEVRLRYGATAVELSVADDGRGFPPGRADAPGPATGFGLRGMRERLRLAGGTLSVTTAPGAGTTVRAEIPA